MLKYIIKTYKQKETETETETELEVDDSESEIEETVTERAITKASRLSVGVNRNGIYDISLINDLVKGSKRFKNLNEAARLGFLAERGTYGYLKKFAIGCWKTILKNKFIIFQEMLKCDKGKDILNDEFANNIFSWTLKDFLARRNLSDFVWVDVLLRVDEESLHIYKFQQDLKQLLQYIEKIFDILFENNGDKKFNQFKEIEKSLL